MASISYAGLVSFLSEVFRVTFFVYDLIIGGVLCFFSWRVCHGYVQIL